MTHPETAPALTSTEGDALLAEGTEVPIKGGKTAVLLYDMLSLVKMEQQFGGLAGIQKMMPDDATDINSISPTMFTDVMRLLHLGFLHLGWSFEDCCAQLLPRHFEIYSAALGKELSFGGDGNGPKPPAPPG